MSDPSNPELDPTLEEWLTEAREMDQDASVPDLDALMAATEQRLEKADKSPRFWLMSRATWARRLIACVAAAGVIVVGGVMKLRSDLDAMPTWFAVVSFGALAFLLGASVWVSLRPLHEPPLPRWMSGCLVGATLGCTFLLALLSPHEGGHDTSFVHEMVSPCLFYGLFLGLPVYLVLRMLDRGFGVGALIASCAAGLAGNLVLSLHCPSGDPTHLMASHFMVAVLFVVGLFAVNQAVKRLRGD